MKRTFLIITVVPFLIASLNMKAQENKNGIRAGYVMGYSSIPEPEALSGFYVGFSHDRPIGDSKLLLLHGGTEYTQAGWGYDKNNLQKLHYISLPSALKLKLGPLFAQGGLALNFKVAEKVLIDGQDAKTDENKSRIFNLPAFAGAGLMIGPLTVEARYNYGLLKVNDNGNKISYLQLGAGIHF